MQMTLSDGRNVTFPEEATPEEISQYISIKYPEEKPPKQLSAREKIVNSLQSIGKPFDLASKNIVSGTAKLNEQIGNIGSKLGLGIPKFREPGSVDYNKMAGLEPGEENEFIQKIPEMVGSVIAPEARGLGAFGEMASKLPGWGKYLKTALQSKPVQQATTQATIAGGLAPEDGAKEALEAGAITLPFAGAGSGIKAGKGPLNYFVNKIRELSSPKSYAASKALKGVPGSDYKQVLEASERLGIPVTPGEASQNPYAIAQQLRTGNSPEGGQKLIDFAEQRGKTEKGVINNFFKNIFNPETEKAEKEALYKAAESKYVPTPELAGLQDDPVFQKAVRNMETGKHKELYEKRLKDVEPNSIKYLNQVKKSLGEMEQDAPYGLKSDYGDVRRDITDVTDKWAETYKPGRALAEREIAVRGLKKAFDKKPLTAENLATAIRGEESYNKLHFNLRNVPETQKQLEDMKLVFDKLIPIDAVDIAKKTLKSDEKSLQMKAFNHLKEKLGSHRYDKAMADLITNPKWADELNKLKKVSSGEKLGGDLLKLLGKVGSQEYAGWKPQKDEE
jgi:hypothetical protein